MVLDKFHQIFFNGSFSIFSVTSNQSLNESCSKVFFFQVDCKCWQISLKQMQITHHKSKHFFFLQRNIYFHCKLWEHEKSLLVYEVILLRDQSQWIYILHINNCDADSCPKFTLCIQWLQCTCLWRICEVDVILWGYSIQIETCKLWINLNISWWEIFRSDYNISCSYIFHDIN